MGEGVDLLRDRATGADQIGHEPAVHVERAFILGPIPHIVALRQDSPDFRAWAERVRQHLKDDLPFRRPESAMPERCEAQRVSGRFLGQDVPPDLRGASVVYRK